MSFLIIQAKYNTLETIAKQFDQQASDIEVIAHRLMQKLEQLQAGGWEGHGAQAFYDEMKDDVIPATNRLRDAFTEGGETTRKIGQVIQAAEQEAAKPFQVNVSLPSYSTKLSKNMRINPDNPSYTVKNGVLF